MKIFVIGNGNLAYSLVPAIQGAGHCVVGIYSRSNPCAIPPDAHIYIICTADAAIADVASMIPTDKIVAHTSGSTGIDVLSARFNRCGVIYPVQTFTKGIKVDMRDVPLLVESFGFDDNDGSNPIVTLAKSLSNDVRPFDSDQRRTLHLAAVFACNFVNHSIAAARLLSAEKNVDYNLLRPLINETIRKSLDSDPILGQSGPAVREDLPIMRLHESMLANRAALLSLYKAECTSIQNFKHNYPQGIPYPTAKN
ncbi:MAG: DUF2520 domain-containing protein [Bacteroidales bacterium]|nr:DUF2520 domain-containing protein [Bacteroidales bacterium]